MKILHHNLKLPGIHILSLSKTLIRFYESYFQFHICLNTSKAFNFPSKILTIVNNDEGNLECMNSLIKTCAFPSPL